MPFNDLFGDGQAQSRSTDLGPPRSMEGVEDPGQILFCQYLEGIYYAYLQKILLRAGPNNNLTVLGGELGGIVKDI